MEQRARTYQQHGQQYFLSYSYDRGVRLGRHLLFHLARRALGKLAHAHQPVDDGLEELGDARIDGHDVLRARTALESFVAAVVEGILNGG